VDGRVHLEQVKLVIAAHKPVFIDKPLAATLADAREIARLAKEAGVPWFSASESAVYRACHAAEISDITGAVAWGPGPLEPHHQLDLSWYAIHAVELPLHPDGTWLRRGNACLHTGRRRGRRQVERRPPGHGSCAAAVRKFRRLVFRSDDKVSQSDPKPVDSYRPLLLEIVKFFRNQGTSVPQ